MNDRRSSTLDFLDGDGEMSILIQGYDWSATPLGPMGQWPQSLRTIVSVIVHSPTPMFLWWGDELIQFYNDAYRPSLGEQGKHPGALGQRGEECWPEIWSIISPLIDQVRAGGAVWMRDRLIPIYRNGSLEDVYWTFGYSPVHDESGKVAGVLVICNETTEQVKALRRTATSERTLRNIFELAPIGICILDSDGLQAEIVNDIALQITGKSREEFLSQPLWQLFPHLERPYADAIGSVVQTGKPYRGHENKLVFFRDGKEHEVFLDILVEPLDRGSDGKPPKVTVLAIDVTDKVLARRKIQESEQRYKTLIAESSMAIAVYSVPDLRIQYVNSIMVQYWAKDMSVIGKTLAEAIPELTSGDPVLAHFQRVFETGEEHVQRERQAKTLRNNQLETAYFDYIFKPLKDPYGRVYAIYHMAMDVTEAVTARKRLELREVTLQNIILRAPVAMCILRGPEMVIEIANELMFRLWGRTREEMLGKHLFDMIPEVRPGFEGVLNRVLETGESLNAEAVEVDLPRGEGTTEKVFINFLYEPYRVADGDVSGVLVVATDITAAVKARQKVEELVAKRTKELAESNMNLRRSNDELAQFAYIASHDLQEPARKIATFIEKLQRTLEVDDPAIKSLLNKIESSSTRMLSLIRDVLSYSQLSRDTLEPVDVDLNKVLQNIIEDFELRIDEKKAKIRTDALPTVKGSPVQLGQLFGNLLSNALKFTNKIRSPEIDISYSEVIAPENVGQTDLKPGVRYHLIAFRDNGIGFNQKNAARIFDIFQRLHGRSEYEGTGIGLSMCKKIALNHNGDIVAESVEGEGSCFHIYLPIE